LIVFLGCDIPISINGCPVGFTSHGGQCYTIGPKLLNWIDAKVLNTSELTLSSLLHLS